jgi:hypothetical protein
MSVADKTRKYATDVADAAINAFQRQARGDLEAPNGGEGVRLFTAKGGSAVTLASTTTSAAVVYDPEASLRNGQLNVVVYERNTSDAVTAVQKVNLGRPTEEFLSAGVLSSGLKVFNSSGVDVIGGTQTAAVLNAVPRDISGITSTTVANACANHERDMASGVVSREDSTLTLSMTDHYGTKACLARTNTLGNTVRRVWDDGVGSRRTTAGSSLGPIVETAFDSLSTSTRTDAAIIADTATHLIDTNNLDEAKNPLTLATYNADFSIDAQFTGASATDTDYRMDLVGYALDAAGTVIASRQVRDVAAVTSGALFMIKCSGSITSTTVPIHRVIVGIARANASQTNLDYDKENSTGIVVGFEETSDIAARPVHVCVLEGLNASATVNLNSFAVITGVPDSTNSFIASAAPDPETYDLNAVDVFLRSVSRSMPRAFTVGGHGEFTKTLRGIYDTEDVSIAFKAMSFSDTMSKIRSAGRIAKASVHEAEKIMKELKPLLEGGAMMASMMPGQVGAAGRLASGAMRSMA